MVSADRDALTCDLAETYGILDWKALPVKLLASLAAGLRENSRIKMILSGRRGTMHEVLLAAVVDKLATLIWFQTEDGHNGVNRPESVLSYFLGTEEPQQTGETVEGFASESAFEEMWTSITGVSHGK